MVCPHGPSKVDPVLGVTLSKLEALRDVEELSLSLVLARYPMDSIEWAEVPSALVRVMTYFGIWNVGGVFVWRTFEWPLEIGGFELLEAARLDSLDKFASLPHGGQSNLTEGGPSGIGDHRCQSHRSDPKWV